MAARKCWNIIWKRFGGSTDTTLRVTTLNTRSLLGQITYAGKFPKRETLKYLGDVCGWCRLDFRQIYSKMCKHYYNIHSLRGVSDICFGSILWLKFLTISVKIKYIRKFWYKVAINIYSRTTRTKFHSTLNDATNIFFHALVRLWKFVRVVRIIKKAHLLFALYTTCPIRVSQCNFPPTTFPEF